MRILLSVLLFLFFITTGFAQYKELFRINKQFDQIALDNLYNIYGVKDAELLKYSNQGVFQFRFSDKQLGQIGSVDVSYPLRPLLVYPELNYIIIVDNTLSNNRGKINLLDYNIGLGQLVCASVQNHFWIYDAMNFALLRVNENFEEKNKSGNLSQILGIELQPAQIMEFANRLYLNNPATGILVFDIFGTYIKTIPVTGLENFQVYENELVYFKDNKLVRYDFTLYSSEEIALPMKCSAAVIQKDRLALLTTEAIVVLEKSLP